MGELALVARLALAAVFVAAAVGKLADRAGSRQAMVDFGLPGMLARPVATVLPGAELAAGLALVAPATARTGAAGALALLVAFSAVVATNLARGRTPDCHCFGQAGATPIGAGTLVRNAVLAGLSGLALAGPDGAVDDWRAVAGAALAGVVALETWALMRVLRQQGRLVLRLDALEAALGVVDAGDRPGLPVGTPAPSFTLPDPWGHTVALEELLAVGRPVMLLFADPGCGPCNGLFPDIGRWQREWRDGLTIAVVSAGALDANRAKATEHGLVNVVVQDRREVAAAYATTATPSAVLVGADGRVASPLVAGGDAIWKLLVRTPARTGALTPEVEVTV